MSVKADPTTAAQAWVTGMSGAGPKYTAGVQAVRVAPGTLAAAKASLWASQVAQAQQKYAANVGRVTLAQWQDAAANKGAQRLASGATAAAPKFAAFMTAFLPQLSSIVQSLPQGGTYEQNKQRALAYFDALHAKAGSF